MNKKELPEELVVRQSFWKQFKLFIMGIFMVIVSFILFMAGIAGVSTKQNYSDSILVLVIGLIGLIFFGSCFGFITLRLLKPKAILIVNQNGIYEHTSGISMGMIRWHEISKIYATNAAGQSYVGIELNRQDQMIEALPKMKQNLIRANLKLGYPPVLITLNSADLKMGSVEFSEVLNHYKEKYSIV